MINSDQLNFGIAGYPVSHSLSPVLFSKYMENQDNNYVYTRILARSIHEISRLIMAFNIQAINITSPFKEEIIGLADVVSPYAKELGASNTLIIKNQQVSAFNTDITGVQIPLTKSLKTPQAFSALVIGSGGAAKAAVKALLNINVNPIFITNRTESKADILADIFKVTPLSYPQIAKYSFDIIVNTTPVLPEILNKLPINDTTLLFDADYKTCPMQYYAIQNNAFYINGIEWLTEQGRAAYLLMTGKRNSNFMISDAQLNIEKKNKNRIALIGMMGTGKSTIGKKLAEKLNFNFFDMDKMIEEIEDQSIRTIFETKGEVYFRSIEKELLKKIVHEEKIIISTGGGIIIDEENIKILKDNCWNILLYGSSENLAEILSDNNRPLLANKDKKTELELIFQERKNKYYKASDLIVCSDVDNYHNISEFIYDDYSKSFFV